MLTLSRWLVAALFAVSGAAKLFSFAAVMQWMSSEGVPAAALVLAATIALEVIGGLLLATGIRVRAVALVFIAFVSAATFQFHSFWDVPAELVQDQLTHFLKNAAIVGALLLLVANSPSRAATA